MIKRLSLLLLTGCMANNGLTSAAQAEDNIHGISRLCIGMKASQVLQVMNYPYSKKTIEHGEDVYDIWFYVTRGTGLDQSRMVRQNLTPLTFENGVLLGWGNDFYHYVLRRLDETKRVGEEEQKPKLHEKDSLEKAIEGIETKPSRQRPPASQTLQSQASSTPSKKGPSSDQSDKKKEEGEGKKKKKDPLKDEDRKMIEEENEQNFDFW